MPRLGLGAGLGVGPAAGGVPVVEEPETAALMARMTVQPTSERRAVYDKFYRDLKTGLSDGLAGFGFLMLMNAHDRQAARLHIIGTGEATEVNAPTWSQDYGFTGDGISKWLNTNYNPTIGGSPFQQNSASFGAFCLSVAANPSNSFGLFNGSNGVQIVPRGTGDLTQFRINQAASQQINVGAVLDGSGLWVADRSSATLARMYRNGVDIGGATIASTAVVNGTFGIGRLGSTSTFYGDHSSSCEFAGRHFTAAEQTVIYNAVKAFNDGVAATSVQNIAANFAATDQTWMGGYIEIQPDSFNGGSSTPATDSTTDVWGFPYSLTPSEQTRVRDLALPGGGRGLKYLRLPLGFAYRGFRNIDGISGLARNIGERFAGQSAALTALIANVVNEGGGLAPEYWAPPPHWLTNSAYGGSGSSLNRLWAGAAYPRSTSLASIRLSDPTQFAAQVEAFTDAILNDFEYLHTNVGPVRLYGLQNEPRYGNAAYGSCLYDDATYSAVLASLEPKVRASAALATWGGQPNTPLLHVNSDDDFVIGQTYIAANPTRIWSYTHHNIVPIYQDADWIKNNVPGRRGAKSSLWINECEFFDVTAPAAYRCANNMLKDTHNAVYGRAPMGMPVIHLLKPLGQSGSASDTEGFGLFKTRLPLPFGAPPGSGGDTNPSIDHGAFEPVAANYNAHRLFADNVVVGAVRVGGTPTLGTGIGFAAFQSGGKLTILLVNRTNAATVMTVPLLAPKAFTGKRYNVTEAGTVLTPPAASASLVVTIPAYSGEAWTEV